MKHLLGCGVIIAAALLTVPASAQNVIPGISRNNGGGGVHNSMGGNGAGHGMGGGGQFRHGGNFAQGSGQRFDRGDRYHGGNGWAAGAAGLAAGAIVGGAIAANNGYYDGGDYATGPAPDPYYNNDPGYAYGAAPAPNYADEGSDASVSYCEQTYHSYDPSSGTYLGFDGQRHSCP